MSGPRILIVEDEFLVRLTLSEALADEGFDVVEAGSGAEALAVLGAHPEIVLLLTDIQLPGGLDGLELARAVRRHVPSMPVIFMTGRPDSIAGTSRSPRDVYIAKPYLPSQVCSVARHLTQA